MGSRGGRSREIKEDNTSHLLRTTSCVGEPQVTALQSLRAGDLRLFTDTVNTVPDSEAGHVSYPLAPAHWVNRVLEGEADKTLLLVAISSHLHHYLEVLLKVGARADQYSQELGLAPIHLAVQVGDLTAVKLLLDHQRVRASNRADINQVNKVGRTALHLAVDQRDVDILDFLLQQKEVEVDRRDNKGNTTALYLAVKNRNPQIVEMLLEHGASLDTVCFGKPIQVHILEKMPGFDVASVNIKKAPVARQDSLSVLDMMANIIDTFSRRTDSKLRDSLMEEFRGLVLQVDSKTLNTHRSSGLTLLQKAASSSDLCCDIVLVLLQEGVDPNYIPEESVAPALLLAAARGHLEVIKVLRRHGADFGVTNKATEETVLHRLLVRDEAHSGGQFEESLKFILDEEDEGFRNKIKNIVNKRDLLGNTALHYATQRWDPATVRLLLERGANIGIKNQWGEVPINKILPSTMESFLDEFCLSAHHDVNHEEFEVTFNYQFLAPPVDSLPTHLAGPCYSDDPEVEKVSDKFDLRKFALPETESLWYMGQSKEHRHLLRHPVITSFLWCKWTRIRRFVNRNLRFYMFFVMILTWYIFENFGGQQLRSGPDKTVRPFYSIFVFFSTLMFAFVLRDWLTDLQDLSRSLQLREEGGPNSPQVWAPDPACSYVKLLLRNWPEVLFLASLVVILVLGSSVLTLALTVLLAGLCLRELFQMAVSLRRYFLTLENWLELVMLVLVSLTLLLSDLELRKHLAAISLLLSWAELVTFVAKHPRLTRYNVYVTMFYKVLSSFFFFLLWYIFFIVAFGLGFYIMLHNDNEPRQDNETLTVTLEDPEGLQLFFNSPFLTFVKTCTMFVGELEFSDIPIDLDSRLMPLSYAFFLAFVFLIVVVLMNLLNGLAVSDTGKIQEQAEIVAYLSRVETISYAESLLLGDPFDFLSNTPAIKWLLDIPSLSFCRHLYRNRTARRIFQRMTGAQGILLFYNHLPDRKLTIKPNKLSHTCLGRVERVGADTVQAAKGVVLRRAKVGQEVEKDKEFEKKLEETVETNKMLVDKVSQLERKIDLLLSKI